MFSLAVRLGSGGLDANIWWIDLRWMPAGAAPSKELGVSVVRATAFQGQFSLRCKVLVSLETGAGDQRNFEGQEGSMRGANRACEVALGNALSTALGDPSIQAYLQ